MDHLQRGGRSSPASPSHRIRLHGSTSTEIFSIRPHVEHSNVRCSNPRSPGEMPASAIRCLHTGHIGRSLVEAIIPNPRGDHDRFRSWSLRHVGMVSFTAYGSPPHPRLNGVSRQTRTQAPKMSRE